MQNVKFSVKKVEVMSLIFILLCNFFPFFIVTNQKYIFIKDIETMEHSEHIDQGFSTFLVRGTIIDVKNW
jgi:hypothetical protein